MSRPGWLLLVLALTYLIGSFVLLRLTTGASGIPDQDHWFLFSFVFPTVFVGAVVWAKLAGVRFSWAGVVAFVMWMVIVGWFYHWLITTIWAVI
jgi:uncharacterized membrane protein YhdT